MVTIERQKFTYKLYRFIKIINNILIIFKAIGKTVCIHCLLIALLRMQSIFKIFFIAISGTAIAAIDFSSSFIASNTAKQIKGILDKIKWQAELLKINLTTVIAEKSLPEVGLSIVSHTKFRFVFLVKRFFKTGGIDTLLWLSC